MYTSLLSCSTLFKIKVLFLTLVYYVNIDLYHSDLDLSQNLFIFSSHNIVLSARVVWKTMQEFLDFWIIIYIT